MKLNCAIVKDLLPLYADDLCSDETTEAVRAHLAECDDCRRAYEAGTVAVTPAETADETPVKPFRKVRRAIVKRAAVIAACVALLMATSIGVVAGVAVDKNEVAITAEIQKQAVCYYSYNGAKQELSFADTDVVTQDKTTGQVFCNSKPLTVPEAADVSLDNQVDACVSLGTVAVYVGKKDGPSFAGWDAYKGDNGELISCVKFASSPFEKGAESHERHYMNYAISPENETRLVVVTKNGDLLYDLNETFHTGKLAQINA